MITRRLKGNGGDSVHGSKGILFSVKSEKRIFQIASKEKHPFLVNMHSCFQTEVSSFAKFQYFFESLLLDPNVLCDGICEWRRSDATYSETAF